jgi:hypothetical protein
LITVIGYRDPRPTDIPMIETTSHSKNWSRGLSPFFLGPCTLYNNYWSYTVENAWQYSKVYKEHMFMGELSPDYFHWAIAGWSNPRANRYPMGKGAKPEFSFWDGKKYKYIEARKNIYIPLYSEAVKKSDAFKQLVIVYKENKDICLLDFDGYNHLGLGMTLEDVVENPNRTMGHAFVLAMLLEGKIE